MVFSVGVPTSHDLVFVWFGLLDHFDLLAFDPRGVGFSTPVTCVTDSQMDTFTAASPDVLTNSGFAAAKALNKSFATSCSKKYGAGLADYNTVNTARDTILWPMLSSSMPAIVATGLTL